MSNPIVPTTRHRYRIRLRTLLALPVMSALGLYLWPFVVSPDYFDGDLQIPLEFVVVDAGNGRPIERALVRVVDAFRDENVTDSHSGRDGRARMSHGFAMRGVSRSYRRSGSVSFEDCWLEVSATGHRSSTTTLLEFTGTRRDLDDPRPPLMTVALREGKDPAPALGFAGTYDRGYGASPDESLTILPDGRVAFRWTQSSGCSAFSAKNLGFSRLTDGVLILNFLLRDGQSPYKSDGEFGRTEFQTQVEFLPVSWGQRTYLIPKEDMLGFCNAINQGLEPRNRAEGLSYLRADDWKKGVAGWPELPAEWMPFLLREPVLGTILELMEGFRARVDLGSKVGIRPGMELSVQGERLFPGRGKVMSVEPDSCIVALPEYSETRLKPGQMVGSRLFNE
jgi:hypothetical protein